jgi:enoyl reductase-like protein
MSQKLGSVEEAKVRRAMAALEAKTKEAEGRLASMEAVHKSAWEQYGSACCAGEMLRKEQELMDEIAGLEAKAELLHRCLIGEIPTVSDEAFIREGMALDAEEEVLAVKRRAYQKRRDEIIQAGALLIQHARG